MCFQVEIVMSITNEMIWTKLMDIERMILDIKTQLQPSQQQQPTQQQQSQQEQLKKRKVNRCSRFISVHRSILKTNLKETHALYKQLTEEEKQLYADPTYHEPIARLVESVISPKTVFEGSYEDNASVPIISQKTVFQGEYEENTPVHIIEDEDENPFMDFEKRYPNLQPYQVFETKVNIIKTYQQNVIQKAEQLYHIPLEKNMKTVVQSRLKKTLAYYRREKVQNKIQHSITYSVKLIDEKPFETVKNVVIHEVSHYVTRMLGIHDSRNHHGDNWQRICIELGGDGKRFYHDE